MTEQTFAPAYNALRNAIYHNTRSNFFNFLNRLLNFLVIVFGAGVAGKAAELIHIKEIWLELGVLVLATAQLAFDFGYRARTHEFLQKRYYEMLEQIELQRSPDEKKWNARLFAIAADEPMPMRAVDALAYNAALDATATGQKFKRDNRLYVPWWHRWLRHFVAFNAYEYRLESKRQSWSTWFRQLWRTARGKES